MKNRGSWRLESQVASISTEAAIVGEALRVPSAADLVVGLIEISEACDEVALLVSLESRSRNDIEDTVGPIPIVRIITTSLHFHIIDVLGIELWPHIAGNVCIRNRYPIHRPADLVSPSNMKLIVGHVRTGHILRDYGQTIRAVGPGRILNGLS